MGGVNGIWAWDQATFRSFHEGLRWPGMDPFWMVVSASALAHIAALPLLATILARRYDPRWRWINLLFLAIVIGVGMEEGLGPHHAVAFFVTSALCWGLPLRVAQLAFWAFTLGGIVHIAMKEVIERMRPSNFDFARPMENVYATASFPSGHTITAAAIGFTLAWCLWHSGLRGWAMAGIGYGILGGLSRVVVGVHYPTDVLAGWCIGLIAMGIVVWRWQPET